ncbi:MAG: hypothetical protein Tsb0034_25780 [Ekhidna sp.]
MAKSAASEKTLTLYDALLKSVGLEKKGKNMPYTSMNGNMYSFVAKEGYVAIRLSEEEKEAFIKKYQAKPAISYGSVMHGYVEVPSELLEKTDELSSYMKMSYEFAKTLKPKQTKKK